MLSEQHFAIEISALIVSCGRTYIAAPIPADPLSTLPCAASCVDSLPCDSCAAILVALPSFIKSPQNGATDSRTDRLLMAVIALKTASAQLPVWAMLLLLASAGCSGKSIKVDNPVFADAPPRRSLVNHAADEEEQRLALAQTGSRTENASGIQPASFSKNSEEPLTGTTVVAEVNGMPIFCDDVLAGARQIIERDPRIPEDKRQMVLQAEIRRRLPKYLEDELIIQALKKKIPEDKRKAIKESLEPQFQKIVDEIKQKEGFVTDQQLDERLAAEGITVHQLRDNFVRMQMVGGYVGSRVNVPETIDREELVRYYQEHIADFTPDEELRFAEIVIRFADHGGREGAEQAMTAVVNQLQSGKDFGDVAYAMSDTLTAEKRGDIGWIKRNSLADKALEEMLFGMPAGSMSRVQVQNDRFEVYKVIDHRNPGTAPFQEVQKEIEELLRKKAQDEARAKIRQEIRDQGTITTMFGDDFELEAVN